MVLLILLHSVFCLKIIIRMLYLTMKCVVISAFYVWFNSSFFIVLSNFCKYTLHWYRKFSVTLCSVVWVIAVCNIGHISTIRLKQFIVTKFTSYYNFVRLTLNLEHHNDLVWAVSFYGFNMFAWCFEMWGTFYLLHIELWGRLNVLS